MPSVILLGVIVVSVIVVSVIVVSVIMLSVIMVCVIMVNVVAPPTCPFHVKKRETFFLTLLLHNGASTSGQMIVGRTTTRLLFGNLKC